MAVTISRRELLVGLGALSVAGSAFPARWPAWSQPAGPAAVDPIVDVLRSYVATLVPGPEDDPRGAPGAVEAGAVEQLLGQAPYVVPLIVADVTAAARAAGRAFTSMAYVEREALLVEAFSHPVRAPYHLIALAVGAGSFYGDFRNHVGGTHIGFPGPSDGYLDTYTDRTGHGQPDAAAIPP